MIDSCTIYIDHIYKCCEFEVTLKIPAGYEASDFRIPQNGEIYLSKDFNAIRSTATMESPRIILKQVQKKVEGLSSVVTMKDIYGKDSLLIPEGYEFVRFANKLYPGEYYFHPNGIVVKSSHKQGAMNLLAPYIILDKI